MAGEHGEEAEPRPARNRRAARTPARHLREQAGLGEDDHRRSRTVANVLFALVVFWLVFMAGVPTLLTEVGTVQSRTSPAADAGLRPGDVVTAIDGRPVESWEDLTAGGARERRRRASLLDPAAAPRRSPCGSRRGPRRRARSSVNRPPWGWSASRRPSASPRGATARSTRRPQRAAHGTRSCACAGRVSAKIFQRIVPADTIGRGDHDRQMAGQQAQLGATEPGLLQRLPVDLARAVQSLPDPACVDGARSGSGIEPAAGGPSRRARRSPSRSGSGWLILLMLFAFYNDIMRL